MKQHKDLNPKLWIDNQLKIEVRDKLMEVATHFYKFLKIDAPILDVFVTGSNASFNYDNTNLSDIDLHISLDFNEVGCDTYELANNLMMTKRELYGLQRSITVKGLPVECYPHHLNQPHHSNGMYSILNSKWLEQPQQVPEIKDTPEQLKIMNSYKELIDDISNVSDPELKKDLATTVKDNLIKKRKDGLENGGINSEENRLFKRLRQSNFDKIFLSISDATDRGLSLEQRKLD